MVRAAVPETQWVTTPVPLKMSKAKKRLPETISQRQACLRIGISVPTAVKINATEPGNFPAVSAGGATC